MSECENEKKECLCQSKGFRKFLIIASGSFVGVYLALSLFFAIHKPPVFIPFPPQAQVQCPCAMMHHMRKFDRPNKPNFEKRIPQDFGQRPPFEAQK